jgi:hypothetical protein
MRFLMSLLFHMVLRLVKNYERFSSLSEGLKAVSVMREPLPGKVIDLYHKVAKKLSRYIGRNY